MPANRGTKRAAIAALLASGLLAVGAGAEEAPAPDARFADAERFEPDAVAAVRRMVDALASAKHLRVRVEEEYDALQPDGQTFSFGKSVEMTLRRPDRLRVVSAEGGGKRRDWSYDGSRITVYDGERNLYASAERSGDVDATLDFLRDDVGL